MELDKINFGIINIDKPSGPTSFTISDYVRKKLKLNKTSHMGTLDPKVTGVLPITLGKACRLAGYIIGHDKTYVGILNTHKEQDIKKLQEIIDKNFVGRIKQTPPHKSAVKRVERQRMVYYFNLLESSLDNRFFLFECKVEGGTYIRKICSDLGEKIGGAHMDELRRIQAGLFDEENIVKLDDFYKAVENYFHGKREELENMITPAQEVVKKIMKIIEVKDSAVKKLLNGKPLFKEEIVKGDSNEEILQGERFGAFCKENLIGVYLKTKEKGIFARPEFVYN